MQGELNCHLLHLIDFSILLEWELGRSYSTILDRHLSKPSVDLERWCLISFP